MTGPVVPSRTLSKTLAAIVADLELTQPSLVSLDELAELAARHGGATYVRELARRLRATGWLLPTGRPGIYEFAPGAHAGPYGHGDPFVALHAELRAKPDLPVRLALHSALWAHGLAERPPPRHEVMLPAGTPASAPLSRAFRVVRFDAQNPPADVRGTPTSTPATVLVHAAAKPNAVRSWTALGEALPELVERSTVAELRAELTQRPASVGARLGYLLAGVDEQLVSDLGLTAGHGTVWFGPRGAVRRFDARWNIADTLLPFDPRQLTSTAAL
jgi:predicted transcriptional regulator of viral defense system